MSALNISSEESELSEMLLSNDRSYLKIINCLEMRRTSGFDYYPIIYEKKT